MNLIIKSKHSFSSVPNKSNEDSIGSTNKALWVIDGATNVFQGQKLTKYDVAWYSNRITELLQLSIDDSSCSIEDILKTIIKQIRKEVKDAIGEKFSIFETQVTASILICRYIQDTLEICSLGDCIAYFQIQEQDLFLQNYHMMQIESNMIDKSFSERGNLEYNKFLKSVAFPKIQNLITKNKEETQYSTLDLDPNSINKGFRFDIPISVINSVSNKILLMTDGFSRFIDYYNEFQDFNEFLTEIELQGVEKLYTRLREIEQNDSEAIKYHRFKIHDDASIILASIK